MFYRLAANDMPIMSLGKDEKSLEDVFLELTGDNDEATAEADADINAANEAEEAVAAAATKESESDREVTENDSDI
jgi:hypothetical protein